MKNLLKEDISKIRRAMGLNEDLGTPIETLNVSSEFNKQRKGYKHQGVDLSTPSGTNVVAIDGGTVIDAEIKNNNCGGTLAIEHPSGFKSRFCHLKQINVKKGDKVEKGQIVALSGGAKGDVGMGRSTGAHLHFELYKNGTLVDPIKYINKTDYNPLSDSTEPASSETVSSNFIGNRPENFADLSKIMKDFGFFSEGIVHESEMKVPIGFIQSMVAGRVVAEDTFTDQCSNSITIMFKLDNKIKYLIYCSVENPSVRVGDIVKKDERIGYSKNLVTAYFVDEKGNPFNMPQSTTPEIASKKPTQAIRSLEDDGDSPWLKDGQYYGNVGDVLGTLARKLNPFSSRYGYVKTTDPITGQEQEKKEKVHQGGLKGVFTDKGPKLSYPERIKYSTIKPEEAPKRREPQKFFKKRKIKEEIDQIKKLMK